MADLGNLNAFIEGCDATKMSAFLELVHRRFLEAQAQKQRRVEGFVSHLHEQVVAQATTKKAQLEQQISGTLSSLSKKRDLAAAELGQRLEEARTKKRTLLLSFQEQEKACQVRFDSQAVNFSKQDHRLAASAQDVQEEMRQLIQQYTIRQQAMEKSQKQALRQFFEDAVQKVQSAQDKTIAALQEAEGERQQAAHMLLQLLIAYSGPEAVSLLAGLHNSWR
ncbi:hypothetical protein Esti_002100 [Eimeria stiedai]